MRALRRRRTGRSMLLGADALQYLGQRVFGVTPAAANARWEKSLGC